MDKISVAQISPILEESFRCLEDSRDEFELPALFELEGAMKVRIHTDGKDSDGNRIGIKSKRKGLYSKPYEKLKRDGGIISGQRFSGAGANIYPINLFVHGDLSRGYSTGKKNGSSVIDWVNDEQRNKAAFAEDNYNVEIFKPTDQELKDMEAVLLSGLDQVLRRCF